MSASEDGTPKSRSSWTPAAPSPSAAVPTSPAASGSAPLPAQTLPIVDAPGYWRDGQWVANSGAFRADAVVNTPTTPNPHHPPQPVPGAAQSGAFGPPGAAGPSMSAPAVPVPSPGPDPSMSTPGVGVVAAAAASAGAAMSASMPRPAPVVSPPEAPAAHPPAPADAPAPQPVVDEDAWYDLEEEDQMRWCMGQMKILKQLLGGHGKLKRDDEDLSLHLEVFDGRAARLTVDGTTGWTYLELSCSNRHGRLDLKFEEGKKPGIEVDDEWEDEGEVVHLFAPGVYVEDEQAEVDRMVALVERLGPDVQRAMFMALQKQIVDDLTVYDSEVRCGFDEPLYRIEDPATVFDRALKVLFAVALAFERTA